MSTIILAVIAAALGSGIVAYILGYYAGRARQRRDDFPGREPKWEPYDPGIECSPPEVHIGYPGRYCVCGAMFIEDKRAKKEAPP